MRRVSIVGINELMEAEAVMLEMYPDQAGKPTIGVGHLLNPDELESGFFFLNGEKVFWRNGITREQALALMTQDLHIAETVVNAKVTVPLSKNQFDALCFFVFNAGVNAFTKSSLLTRLNQGQYEAVPGQMRLWVWITEKNGTKRRSQGLINRREREIKIWQGEER